MDGIVPILTIAAGAYCINCFSGGENRIVTLSSRDEIDGSKC